MSKSGIYGKGKSGKSLGKTSGNPPSEGDSLAKRGGPYLQNAKNAQAAIAYARSHGQPPDITHPFVSSRRKKGGKKLGNFGEGVRFL